jgi:hypothetical protein
MSADGQAKEVRPGFPSDERERLWGSRGTGDACSHCQQRIEPEEAQLELVRPGALPVLQFHVRCYDAWRAHPR